MCLNIFDRRSNQLLARLYGSDRAELLARATRSYPGAILEWDSSPIKSRDSAFAMFVD